MTGTLKNTGMDALKDLNSLRHVHYFIGNTFEAVYNSSKDSSDTYGMSFFNVGSASDAPTTNNRWVGIQWSNTSGTYGFQVTWSFDGYMYIRNRTAGAWGTWRKI